MTKRLNGSAIKYINALSPAGAGLGAAGSSNASYLPHASWGTLLVHAGSANNFVANVMRSGTSNGTFANFGASLTVTAGSGKLYVRSFTMDSSAVWYKVSYDNNNAGSFVGSVMLVAADNMDIPINQDGNTTVYSDVI